MTARMRAVIAARLRQLTPTAQRVAEIAAAIGRDFDVDVLAASADLDEPDLVEGLDELWRRRIIREHGLEPVRLQPRPHPRGRVRPDRAGRASRAPPAGRAGPRAPPPRRPRPDRRPAGRPTRVGRAGPSRLRDVRACRRGRGAGPCKRRGDAPPLAGPGDPGRVPGEPGPRRPRAAPAAPACHRHSSRSRVTPRDARRRRPIARVHSPRTWARSSTSGSRSMGCGRCASSEGRWIGQERSPRPLSGGRTDIRNSHRRVTWPWVDPSRSWASRRRPWRIRAGDRDIRARRVEGPRPRGPIPASAPCRGDRTPCGLRVERQPPRSGRAGRSPLADSLEGPYMKMIAQSYAAILDQIDGDVDAMLQHGSGRRPSCAAYGFAYYREWPLILRGMGGPGSRFGQPGADRARPRRDAFDPRPRTAAVLPVAAR